MKPNFALSLSFDGIRLQLRAAGGWQLVGTADVADPELAQALADLRNTAEAHRPEGVLSKLIIPDEQIRYLTVQTGALSDADRLKAARDALEGATPYPVDALAFDISADGDTTHVAAVARETLAEAEAFATEHAFNPVSFVAAPEKAGFLGEPFFGTTSLAKSLVPGDAAVEPDGVRVVMIGEAPPLDLPDDVTADSAGQDVAPPAVGDAETPAPPSELQVNESSAPTPTETLEAKPEPDLPALDPQTPQEAATAQGPDPATEVAPSDGGLHNEPEGEVDADPVAAPDSIAPPASPTAPGLLNGVNEPHVPQPKAPPTPGGDATLGFASRRGARARAAAPLGGVTRTDQKKQPTAPKPVAPPAPPIAPPQATVDSLRPVDPPVRAPEPAAPAPEPRTADGGGFLSRRKAPKEPATRTSKAAPSADVIEARRMTIFGARDDVQVGGKPRYLGLVLMAALLVFLAGVAAWATVFLDDGLARLFPGRERTLASTLPEETQSALANDVGLTTAPPPDEAGADGVEMASLSAPEDTVLTPEDEAVLNALRDPRPEPEEDPAEVLDGAALDARYAVTGIWPKAPDGSEPAALIPLEDLYVTSIDPISPALDAVALPAVTMFQTDDPLALVTSPVAAGTNFALGTDGRVIATIEGALSPDGHLVFLGRPPEVPPATPVRFATDPTETGTLDTLTQVRPRARPGDLIEQNERATLGGLSRSELADLRPRLRPQALQEQAEEAQRANASDDGAVSPLATAQSLRPNPRPDGFARLVARATPSPASTASVATAPASVAPRSVTPSIPSSASVSREATTRNAINLRRVNLIGVYGKPSDRRALVRLSNGRYRKVQVGDRIDGGRVSAIGDSELRYQKGSRNLILKMPQG